MLESTFQLGPGLGPSREGALWRAGVARWEELETAELRLPALVRERLRAAIAEARAALEARDVARLAELVPPREHWRLLSSFGADAAYLDIETGDDDVAWGGISAIGLLDRHGPRLLLAERDLASFPELTRGWSMLVTFNGLAFDVPILRAAFPGWAPPPVHLDLRHLLPRLGHHGTLKHVEQELRALHLVRPAHLEGLGGWAAAGLFRRGRAGDREMLRRFAEYNLYDVIGLRTLLAYAHNRLLAGIVARAPALENVNTPLEIPGRGDVLYDVTKILLSL